jgi:hypothetical protein
MDYFQREQLCLSVQQRKVDLLTITSKENGGNQRKKVVFFTARVHPGRLNDGINYFADLRMTFRQNCFLQDWFRNKFGVGLG